MLNNDTSGIMVPWSAQMLIWHPACTYPPSWSQSSASRLHSRIAILRERDRSFNILQVKRPHFYSPNDPTKTPLREQPWIWGACKARWISVSNFTTHIELKAHWSVFEDEMPLIRIGSWIGPPDLIYSIFPNAEKLVLEKFCLAIPHDYYENYNQHLLLVQSKQGKMCDPVATVQTRDIAGWSLIRQYASSWWLSNITTFGGKLGAKRQEIMAIS